MRREQYPKPEHYNHMTNANIPSEMNTNDKEAAVAKKIEQKTTQLLERILGCWDEETRIQKIAFIIETLVTEVVERDEVIEALQALESRTGL